MASPQGGLAEGVIRHFVFGQSADYAVRTGYRALVSGRPVRPALMKYIASCFAVIVTSWTFGPSAAADQLVARSVVQIDCSAYQRQSDGAWTALRQNKVMRDSKIAREIVPGDDLEVAKMTDGKLLKGLLNSMCTSMKK